MPNKNVHEFSNLANVEREGKSNLEKMMWLTTIGTLYRNNLKSAERHS
jgi:hypothetical protein